MAIAKLSIDLEARLTKLESSLKQATSLAEQSATKIKSAFSGLTLVFSGLAGALSVGALKGAFDKYVEGAANLERLAKVAGTTTENISGLASVAKISGTDVDTLSNGMVRLASALSKADDESKGAGKAFAALGLDPEKLRTKDTADALLEVAKAFATIQDGSSKTALAVAVFGKAGAQLLPYLNDLASVGGIVAKVTTEQGLAAKEYEQNLKRLEAAQGSVAKVISAEILPAANAFVKTLVELITQTDGVTSAAKSLAKDGSIRAWAETGAMGVANLIDAMQLLKKLVVEVATPIERLGRNVYNVGALAGIAGGGGSLDEKRQAMDSLRKESEAYFASLDKRLENNRKPATLFSEKLGAEFARQPTDKFLSARAALQAFENPKRQVTFANAEDGGSGSRSKAAKAVDDGQRLVEQLKARILAMQDLTELERLDAEIADGKYKTATPGNIALARAYAEQIDYLHGLKAAADEEAEAQRKRLAVFEEGKRVFESVRTPIEALDAELEKLVSLLDNDAISMETFGRAAQKAGKEFQAIKEPLSEMDQFAVQAAKNIQDAFAEFLFDPFANGTKTMLESFGIAVRRMIANAVAADLGKRLFGDIGSGSGVGGLVGEGLGWLKGAIGGSFAVGTDYVPRDMIAQIHKGERIIPAAENRAGFGGHSVSVVVNMGGGGSATDVRRAGGAVAREVMGVLSSSRRYA